MKESSEYKSSLVLFSHFPSLMSIYDNLLVKVVMVVLIGLLLVTFEMLIFLVENADTNELPKKHSPLFHSLMPHPQRLWKEKH